MCAASRAAASGFEIAVEVQPSVGLPLQPQPVFRLGEVLLGGQVAVGVHARTDLVLQKPPQR
jgi:hypothetical protein